MAKPEGFSYEDQPGAGVLISHHGRPATRLRGSSADRFLNEVRSGDAQLVMARWTGNYKRGNERTARDHPRNRGR
ncbi:hypothetical protein LHJ74_14240 [Streptomyces sp. N2-109]|uniref:Hydrophilic protein n=1 Tax=Streptomyces gossypii TaxID=2883101 RepID=A0ABT2JUL9_9ACTN|nr:hypothetical protein [Streptomyces gossypii]MCT2591055.1 hypothetical protein [Streptomyces gossypii]